MQTPYTSQNLLEYALEREQEYLALASLHPSGTYHEGRNTARLQMEQALQCARWMEVKGLAALAHVGPFASAPFSNLRRMQLRGKKVRILAGALIRSLHPSQGGSIVTERARVVRLHDVYSGYVDLAYFRRDPGESDAKALVESMRQPEAMWQGTGGYWCHADLNDVELLEVVSTDASEAALIPA